MSLTLGNQVFETDEEGFLQEPALWTEELAIKMAADDGIALGDDHWAAIHFLREYYEQYSIAPPVRILVRNMGKQLGREKANTPYLYDLFPLGPAKQACRYAGLPKPTGCI